MTTQPRNQRPAAPQPAPPQVWCYPFPATNSKEITDPEVIYRALGRMEDGYFPLGVNGFPHGGVHFGAGSARDLKQSAGVRVIANGEIVAYRLNSAYEHIQFTQDHRWGMYSTGFVLVRHQMTMPPAPGSTAAQPADETLTFFSLYMHMADWQTYLADGNLVRPGWWPGIDAYRIGNKDRQLSSDSDTDSGAAGTFVCLGPGGKRVAFLPENSEVIIGKKRGAWGHIKSITAGTMISPTSGGYFGQEDGLQAPWVRPDGDDSRTATLTPEGDWGWINFHDQRALKEPQDVGQLVIPPQPIQVNAGTLLGQLGEYHDYERSTPMPPVPARQLLHLEVFAGEELKAFIEKGRARAAQLPVDERTILFIQAGAKLVQKEIDANLTLGDFTKLHDLAVTADSPKAGCWMKVQPRTQSADKVFIRNYYDPVWIRRDDEKNLTSPNGLKAWSHFPLQLKAVADPANGTAFTMPHAQLDSVDAKYSLATDDKGVTWWRIEYGTADNKSARGWVCAKDHPGTSWESPWAWPGFNIVDATGINLADAFKRNLVVCGNTDWKEQKEFEPSVAAVNGSALLQRLEQTVARQPLQYNEKREKGKNGEEVVTARMLSRAMGTPWLASELAHVILRYESEWGGSMSRWDSITPLMRNARENWQCELTRIKKLQWWDDVKGKLAGFPASLVVNHIHPVAIVGNFIREPGARTISENGIRFIFKQESLAGVTNKLHWPGGASGVTLGPGYDMKERSAASIQADMKAIGLDDATASTISRAAGLTGQRAKTFCHDNPDAVDLSEAKQVELLKKVVPPYEKMVNRAIKVDLKQIEFDALVSYAYNPGGGWSKVTNFINHKDSDSAMTEVKKHVTSGGVAFSGLVKRRNDEVTLYVKGLYEFHGMPIVIKYW